MGLRASPAELSMWFFTYFSHPSLVIYFSATPQVKLKVGHQIGERLLIANHLEQSLWLTNQKHSAAIRSYLLHSWRRPLLRLLQATANYIIIMSQNYFPDPNRHISRIFYLFLHPILLFKITWCVPLEMLNHLHHIGKMACKL